MREIKIEAGMPLEYIHAMVVGLPSSGKTHFAASAPKPRIIAHGGEGGFMTIRTMDPELWWDPKSPPSVVLVEDYTVDLPMELSRLEQLAAAGKFPYKTLVIDPLSNYVDAWLGAMRAAPGSKDGRAIYGDLAVHLQSLVMRAHALPCHVLWCCHVENASGEDSGILIGGQMKDKFPSYCDFKWMLTVKTAPNQPATYELRTAPYRSWTFLGGRQGKHPLPDPLIPSFKVVAQLLGLREKPVSPAVPGYPAGVEYTSS